MQLFPIVALACAIALGLISQPGVRADTTEDEPIRLSPQRLILGPLAYGEPGSTTLVREVQIEGLSPTSSLGAVDLSHAPGVQVLNHLKTGHSTILRLGINVAQFTSGAPYGIFIKRPVRLETTSCDQPQLLLPIMGWTALNKTSRNFNDYLYSGHQRWQGIWSTPNDSGAVLAPLLLLALGGAAALSRVKDGGRRWLRLGASVSLFAVSGVLLALLGATYSRGAWIAFVAGSFVLILFSSCLRRFVLCGLLVFILIIFLLPSGLKRVDSYAQVQQDPSVAHRLELWTGALQIMGDHPFGVGSNQFGPVFERDYQRFDHVALNSTAVSDYLTFGSERGVLFLSAILGSLILVLFLSLRAARVRDNPWQLTLSAAFLAILVASVFSTLWFVPDYQRLFGLILTGLLICLLAQGLGDAKKKLKRMLALEGVFVLGSVLVVEIAALSSLLLQPTRSSDISMVDSQGTTCSIHRIEPRWHKTKGVIIYFPGERDSLSLLCHSTLRPLAALGWQVWTPNGIPGYNPKLAALSGSTHLHLPVFLAGQNKGGRLAWLAVAHLSWPVVRAGAGLDFLTMDLDPARGGASFQTPFLVFHFLYDDHVSANPAIRASRHTAFSGLPLTIRLSPMELAAFSAGTNQWVEALDHYFSARTNL
jgi:O-Antigen ligase